MSSPFSVGYLKPDPSRIRTETPVVRSAGRLVTDWSVPDWHYLTDLTIQWSFDADLEGITKDCAISPQTQIGALLAWRSGRTNLQGSGPIVSVADGQNSLAALLPGRDLGGSVTVEARVVLLEPDSLAEEFAPKRPGSLLWREERRITLEGSGGRFPTVATDFPPAGLPAGEAGVWYLDIADADLGASATQALRLYVNTANPSIRSLLDNPADEASIAMMRFVRYDTARQLLQVALSHEEFDDHAQYSQGTLGEVLVNLIRLYLPGRNIGQLRAEYPLNFSDVDAELLAVAWRDPW